MALQAYCANCHRTVYIEATDTPICPVCSSPLLDTHDDDPDADQTAGAK